MIFFNPWRLSMVVVDASAHIRRQDIDNQHGDVGQSVRLSSLPT